MILDAFRRVELLDPSEYTVAGEQRSFDPDIANRVTQMCEQNRFAVVLDAYTDEDFGALTAGVHDNWGAAEAVGRIVQGRGDYRSAKHEERTVGINKELEGEMFRVLTGTLGALHAAARTSRIINPAPTDNVHRLSTNKTGPGFVSKLHQDPFSSLVIPIEGDSSVTMGRLDNPWLPITHIARFDFPPNSALIMPFRWRARQRRQPVHHQITNTTPNTSESRGIRTSLVAFY